MPCHLSSIISERVFRAVISGGRKLIIPKGGRGRITYITSVSPPINGKLPPGNRITFPHSHPHSPHAAGIAWNKNPVFHVLTARTGRVPRGYLHSQNLWRYVHCYDGAAAPYPSEPQSLPHNPTKLLGLPLVPSPCLVTSSLPFSPFSSTLSHWPLSLLPSLSPSFSLLTASQPPTTGSRNGDKSDVP